MKSEKGTSFRAQVATEFLVYTGVFMALVILAFFAVNSTQKSELPMRQNALAKETADGFFSVLSLSVRAGDGFSYSYEYPKSLLGIPYSYRFIRNGDQTFLQMSWAGTYENFTYMNRLPNYRYVVSPECLENGQIISDNCQNKILLKNERGTLTITVVS